jgi:hypothetical protein
MGLLALLSPLGLLSFCLFSLKSGRAGTPSVPPQAKPAQTGTVDTAKAGSPQTATSSRVNGLAVPGWDIF